MQGKDNSIRIWIAIWLKQYIIYAGLFIGVFGEIEWWMVDGEVIHIRKYSFKLLL